MKKVLSVFVMTLLICSVFAGCSSKEPITLEKFTEVAESKGCTVEQDFYEGIPNVNNLVSAIPQSGEETYYISFAEFDHADAATGIFEENHERLEKMKGNASATSSTNTSKYSSYKLTTNDRYYRVVRVENTMLYVEAEKEYKDDVEAFMKEFGL